MGGSFMPAILEKPTLTVGNRAFTLTLGVVESTMLGYEDHGIFTAHLYLDYGSSYQGAGGLFLDIPGSEQDREQEHPYPLRRRGTAFGMDWIMRVLDVVGVEKWEDLPGKRLYAMSPDNDYLVRGIASATNPEFRYLIFEDHLEHFRKDDGRLR